MPDTETVPTRLEFAENHRPGLAAGAYEITVTQTLSASAAGLAQTFTATQPFDVAGERFALKDDDVVSVFPPPGSMGDHANVLPHVVLRRSTLPWERRAVRPVAGDSQARTTSKSTIPWLAVLVFGENEITPPNPPNVRLSTLTTTAPGWPAVTLESGQHADDPVAVIEVPRTLLTALLPTAPELRWLTHVRRPTDAAGALAGDEWAVVVANRLPAPNATSVAHLVSLENRYRGDAGESNWTFDDGPVVGATVRLVSLKSWRFSCLDDQPGLAGLLEGLDRWRAELRLPHGGTAEPYLRRGYVPLPHALRGGAATVSWYHGPLVPPGAGESVPADRFPVGAADRLVRYHRDQGMFDGGYAAAWELGRLLALDNDRVAAALYGWRHGFARWVHAGAHAGQAHLSTPALATAAPPLPEVVLDWMARAALLHGVPFNYLVPDERMLPVESIRFFTVDRMWVASLLDGAFGVGRTTSAHLQNDAMHQPAIAALVNRTLSGFLVRSEVVAGWPTLQADGYDYTFTAGDERDGAIPLPPLPLLRMERLSDSVLLCLFEGSVKVADLHQRPEALHFGVTREPPAALRKQMRNARGVLLESEEGWIDPVPLRAGGKRVLQIATLVNTMENRTLGAFTPAHFALQMVEGVPRVRFVFVAPP
ncbi:MAG TPA: hypothetical protein VEQ60_29620 [Longimicrobium sp.]|nr:hypothetical protein [Longimicrobium sp.]